MQAIIFICQCCCYILSNQIQSLKLINLSIITQSKYIIISEILNYLLSCPQVMQQATPQRSIQIGHATFSPAITKPALKKLLTSIRQKTLKQETWMIPCQSSSSDWSNIFPLITTASNLHLRLLAGQLRQTIFKQISHVHFTRLQQLNLLNNQITSVQGVLFLNCPHLQKLGISTNRVAIISPILAKLYFPNLRLVDCSDNYFSQANLGRFLIKGDEMKIFLFQQIKQVGSIEDITIFTKSPYYNWPKLLQFFNSYKTNNPISSGKWIAQSRSAKSLIKKFKPKENSRQTKND